MRIAARIQEKLGVKVELQVGARGQFDVLVDDQVVAQKQGGQFPDADRTVEAVSAKLGRAI